MLNARRSLPRISIYSFFFILGIQIIFGGCGYINETASLAYTRVGTVASLHKIEETFGIATQSDLIYFSDGSTGTIWVLEGSGIPRAFARGLSTPSAISFLRSGELIVADTGSHTIKKIGTDGTISIFAGISGVAGKNDGPAGAATFNAPVGIAVAEDGTVYVSDTYNDRIRRISDGLVSTIAGSERGFADGSAAAARFDTPLGIGTWHDKLLVADSGNGRLRMIADSGDVSTLAGTGERSVIDGPLSSAGFFLPTAVTADDRGRIFVADGHSIRVIGRRTFPFVETIAGERRGFADGSAANSSFNRPSGLAVGSGGEIFVADSDNRVVRVISDRDIADPERAPVPPPDKDHFPLAERWPYDPPNGPREVAGTLGEIRGELSTENKPAWFHNGLDIAGAYGEVASFIRDETVLDPHSVQNVGTARELLRLPTIGYIHLRLGRTSTDSPFNDRRFQFDFDHSGKVLHLRVPRGARFAKGDALGTLNSQNHVHLIAGRSGNEINALAALSLPGISDKIAPTIETVTLFDQNWREIETEPGQIRIKLTDRTRIVARAYDRMDGNSERRRLGVYKLGYQILAEGTEGGEVNWTIVFDRMPSNDAVFFAYALGSQSGYTGQTVFNYIASNRLSGDQYNEGFVEPASLAAGKYVLRVFAADFFGNTASKDIPIEVLK